MPSMMPELQIVTLDEIQNEIANELGVMLYFSGIHCNVCHALRPKVKELFDEHFPQIKQHYIDAENSPEVAAHYNVFAVPTMIVFLDRREFAREGRAVSLVQLREKLARPYGMMTE
jgi:thioredoxin-like negative regulator of GroEL